jgi:hypothetical protein
MINHEKLAIFLPRSRMSQRCLLLPLLSIVEDLLNTIRKKKEGEKRKEKDIKGILIGTE